MHQSRHFCFIVMVRISITAQYTKVSFGISWTETIMTSNSKFIYSGSRNQPVYWATFALKRIRSSKKQRSSLWGKRDKKYYDLAMSKPTLEFRQTFSIITKNKKPQLHKKMWVGVAVLIRVQHEALHKRKKQHPHPHSGMIQYLWQERGCSIL